MTTIYRPFRPSDQASLVSLWNLCLHRDPINEDVFRHKVLLDPNLDLEGFWVAEREGELVGAALGLVRRTSLGDLGLETERGWISFLFVHPAWQHQGIGKGLLEHVLGFFTTRQRQLVQVVGYAPYYFFPGVDPEAYPAGLAFFKKNGFRRSFEAVAMARSIEELEIPAEVRERRLALKAQGYEVDFLRDQDILPLLAFTRREFPGWYPSVLDGLQRGFQQKIVVARKGDEVVGFAQWENTFNDPPAGAPGRFGPFGVRADLRSQGLGSVLFYYLLEAVRRRGARYLWLGWAGGRNINFYRRAGLAVTRHFEVLQLELNNLGEEQAERGESRG